MKEIRKRLRKKYIVNLLVAFILAAILFAIEADDMRILFPTSNLANLTPDSKLKEGAISSARIYAILDWVAEDDEGKYYLVPASDNNYVLFYVYSDDDARFEKIYNATWEYMIDNTDTIEAKSVMALGPVWEIDDELIEWTVDWFEYYEFFEDDAESHIVPYVMVYVPLVEWFSVGDWTLMIAMALCMIWFLCVLVRLIAGGGKGALKKYMQQNGITPEQMDSDIENGVKFQNALLTRRELVAVSGLKAVCYGGKDIVWAYVQHTETTHRTYGIKTGVSHSYSVVLNDRQGKKHVIFCKNEDEARNLLREFSARFPHVLLGAGKEIMDIAKSDYSRIVKASDERLYNNMMDSPIQSED